MNINGKMGQRKSQFNSVQFSLSDMSNPLWPHGLQHTRLSIHHQVPELTHTHVHRVSDTIQPSNHLVLCHPLLLLPPIFPSIRGFSNQVAKVLEFQLQHQYFQWIFRTDFLYDWLARSPCSPRDSHESSPKPQFKSINSSVISFLYSPTLTSIHLTSKASCMDTWSRWTFVDKVISLVFNTLSRFVIAFLPRNKCLLTMY